MWDMQDKNKANSGPICCVVHFANALLVALVHFVLCIELDTILGPAKCAFQIKPSGTLASCLFARRGAGQYLELFT